MGQRILVVGTDDWAIEQAAGALERGGHAVARCHDVDEATFPCRFLRGGGCPVVEGVDAVLTVRGRVAPDPTPGEIGVVCGARAGIPVVVAGVSGTHPFASFAAATVAQNGDVVSACEAVGPTIDLRAEGEPRDTSVRFGHA